MQNRSFTSIMYYSAGDKKQTPIKDVIKVVLCQTNSRNFINNYKSWMNYWFDFLFIFKNVCVR